MRTRLLLAATAAVVLIAIVVVVLVGGGDSETAPSQTLRRPPAPPPTPAKPALPPRTGEPDMGAAVFAEVGCGNCHTLAAAGSTGMIGPPLDGRTPSYGRFLKQVTDGGFGMPPYGGTLSDDQIQDVVAFVLESIQR